MRDAQLKQTNGDQHYPDPHGDGDDILDDRSVLEHLEADLGNDDHRNRIVGIGNGLLAGAAVWALLFIAASLLF